MKNYLTMAVTVALTIALVSCEGEVESFDEITNATATRTAVAWMKLQFPDREDFEIDELETNNVDENASAYIIKFAAGGFVIVSANADAKPILAYSNTNPIARADTRVNALVTRFVDQANKIDISATDQAKNRLFWSYVTNPIEGVRRYARDATMTVSPLIETQWSQSGGYSPNFTYNAKTPLVNDDGTERAPVGCTAVALGQMLKYYNYPKKGLSYNRYCSSGNNLYNCYDGEIIEANFSTNYDWANMPNSLSSISPKEEVEALSKLLFHVGVAINVRYGEHGSSAQIDNPSVFSSFRKHFQLSEVEKVYRSDYSNDAWIELIKEEIQNQRPVVLSGYDSSVSAGHAYILDGLNSEGFVHVNWGWGGSANGYYDLNTLTIDGRYSFTEDLIAFVNFTPHVIEEDGRCNGPNGQRCITGLVCALGNDVTNVADEFSSDEFGQCMDPTVEPEEPQVDLTTIVDEFSGSIARSEWSHFGPFPSQEDIDVAMSGSDDADLYVKKGSRPSSSDYDCRPYKSGSLENCNIEGAGEFFVSVSGYATTSEFSLVVTTKN